jgi:hypothetical protein
MPPLPRQNTLTADVHKISCSPSGTCLPPPRSHAIF